MSNSMLKKMLQILDKVQAMSPGERGHFEKEGMERAIDVLNREYHEDRDFIVIGEELFDQELVSHETTQYQMIEEKNIQ